VATLSPQVTPLCNEDLVAQRAKSIVERAKRMLSTGLPTDDNVTVPMDSRRLYCRETVEASVNEVGAIRELAIPTRNIAYGVLRSNLNPLLEELARYEADFVVSAVGL
jgi:hypothetical protein